MTPITISSGPKTERPILIVDGFNIFLRHFIVNETVNSSGDPVGGVVGLLKSLINLTNTFVPKKIYVVWEQGGGSPKRKKIFEGYKANRTKNKDMFKDVSKDTSGTKQEKRAWILNDTENRLKQLHLLTQILKQVPVCQVYIPETECDDIVGYLVKYKLRNSPAKKIVVSSDKDFYQLLEDPLVEIYDPGKHEIVTGTKVLEKYGISARNFCVAKTLVGDSSDNINGIEGIGFKTAAKRFPNLGSAEKDVLVSDILSFAEEQVKNKSKIKIYKEVMDHADTVQRNWKLMYFDTSNLAASQQDKIDYIVDNHKPQMNKLGLIKTIVEAGVATDIDYDKISVQFKTTLIE